MRDTFPSHTVFIAPEIFCFEYHSSMLLSYDPTKKLSLGYVCIINITSKFSTCTMFVVYADELLIDFEAMCSALTGLW